MHLPYKIEWLKNYDRIIKKKGQKTKKTNEENKNKLARKEGKKRRGCRKHKDEGKKI